MEPRNDLLANRDDNEAYALAEQSEQYAVYFTGDGDRFVELNVEDRRLYDQMAGHIGQYLVAGKSGVNRWLNQSDSTRWQPMAVSFSEIATGRGHAHDHPRRRGRSTTSTRSRWRPTPVDATIYYTTDGNDPTTASTGVHRSLHPGRRCHRQGLRGKNRIERQCHGQRHIYGDANPCDNTVILPNGGTIGDNDDYYDHNHHRWGHDSLDH